MASEPTNVGGSPPWGAWLAALACLAVALLSLLGRLAPLGLRLDLSSAPLSAALALVGLGPTVFYAFSLERGKAAPALRHPLAPWVLLAFLHLCVQLSGGWGSPLWPAYPLLILLVARHAELLNAGLVCGAVLLLEGFPLWAHAQQDGLAPWPRALALLLPAGAFLLGTLREERGGRPAPSSPRPVGSVASPAPSSLPIAPPLAALGGELAVTAQLERDLGAGLDLMFHSHPELNSVSLWWGDEGAVELAQIRMRQGQARAQARVEAGQGHLGLVLRERRLLSVEPLPASAAAGLPWAQGPYACRALRVLPLSDEGRVVGLLAADKAQEEAFSPQEAAALEALSRLLIQHAQRAAQLTRLQDQGGRSQRLYEASKALGADLDREALLARFGALLATLVASDSWTLGMREVEGGPLLRLAGAGYDPVAGLDLGLEHSSALAGTLAQAEGALIFNRSAGAQIPAALLEGLLGEAQHFLLAPLRLGGRLTGVLKLDRRSKPFDAEERDAAFIFASQAAVVLEHARLYSLHRRLATTDGLTGLYNHRYFQERLAIEVAQAERSGKPLSLALTDIDFFKKFNDTFGHQEGDVVLRKVAQLCQEQVRGAQDVVCRYGGEEFVVILPDCDVVEARQVLDRLRAFSAEHMIGGSGPQARAITLSVGLSAFPQCGKEPRELIHAADEALYKAKQTGRDRVCSYKDL